MELNARRSGRHLLLAACVSVAAAHTATAWFVHVLPSANPADAASSHPFLHLSIWVSLGAALLLLTWWSSQVLGKRAMLPLLSCVVGLLPELLIWSTVYLPVSRGMRVVMPLDLLRITDVVELPGRLALETFFNTLRGRWMVGLSTPSVARVYFELVWLWVFNAVGWVALAAVGSRLVRVLRSGQRMGEA